MDNAVPVFRIILSVRGGFDGFDYHIHRSVSNAVYRNLHLVFVAAGDDFVEFLLLIDNQTCIGGISLVRL